MSTEEFERKTSDFITRIANDATLIPPPKDKISREFCTTICEYTELLLEVYSATPPEDWFENAVRSLLSGVSYADIKNKLSRIAKAIETTFRSPLDWASAFPDSEFQARLSKVCGAAGFLEFAKGFYESSSAFIQSYTNEIDEQNAVTELDVRSQAITRDFLVSLRNSNKEAKVLTGEAKNLNDQARESSEAIMPNLLSILGIFVAIIVVFVGAYLSVILGEGKSNFAAFEIPQVSFLFLILMGQILINVFSLFMFFISRLSGRSINTICHSRTGPDCKGDLDFCAKCKTPCTTYHRVMRKYTYIVLLNAISFIAYGVVFVWWYVDTFIFPTIYAGLMGHPIIASLVLLVILLIAWGIFRFTRNLCKKHSINQTASGDPPVPDSGEEEATIPSPNS